jgi:hypothetical protein
MDAGTTAGRRWNVKKAIEKIVEKACAEVVAAVHAHLLGQLGGEKSPKADKPAKSANADTGKKRGRPKLTDEQKAARKVAKAAAASAPAAEVPAS